MSGWYQPGAKWEAKQGDRVIRIVCETSEWRGERQFQVLNLENRRLFSIGINGLSRKYRVVACSIPPDAARLSENLASGGEFNA